MIRTLPAAFTTSMTQAELDALIARARKPLALELTVSDWEAIAQGGTSYRGLPIFLTERRSRVVSEAARVPVW